MCAYEKSIGWREALNNRLHDLKPEANNRNRLAAGLYHLSNEHHYSIVESFTRNLPRSASALLRPQFEAYIRGLWIYNCTCEKYINEFSTEKKLDGIHKLIYELENLEEFKDKRLSNFKDKIYGTFCDFTHGGSIQTLWSVCDKGSSIGSAYTPEQIEKLLDISNAIALKNAIAFAKLDNNEEVVKKICDSHKKIFKESFA